MTNFVKNFQENTQTNGENDNQREENNKEEKDRIEKKDEEEYNDFDEEKNSNKGEEEEPKEETVTINYEKINSQVKRAKELKQIVKLEEEYFENMFNIDVIANSHSKLERLAQGLCKNALVQTFEGTEFGTQTEKMYFFNLKLEIFKKILVNIMKKMTIK